jgi:biopolymer transport protein TolQ
LELWDAFMHSGWVGRVIFFILLLFSFFSWATMILVGMRLGRARRSSGSFVSAFRKSRKLAEVHTVSDHLPHSPLSGIFKSGYAEIEAQVKTNVDDPNRIRSITSVERALSRAIRSETGRLSRHVGFLATTAAATPFIGLFGTVWGIMQAFMAIGLTGNTSLVAVAPGIAEALVNTAAGLFAAIPALIAYNYLVQKIRAARGEMEEFSLEFLNLTERNFT